MIVERTVGNARLRVECAARLAPAARDVLDTIERLAQRDPPLAAGWRIRLGWSVLTLKPDADDAMRVHEPDFAGDPRTRTVPTIDRTLDTIVAQARVARRVGITPVDVSFDQTLTVRDGALDAPRLGMLRSPPETDADSGWFVASTAELDDEPANAPAHTLPVYQLTEAWPVALAVLVLPAGYTAEVARDHIVHVWDAEGHECWQSRAPRQ